jgi:transcriptional regulator with XRE-family HTH domain
MTKPPARRCTDCGEPQTQTRRTVNYPESGLNNVVLSNVPVWVCPNNHEEKEIPAISQLHELLAQMIIRKPAPLVGAEIRFLRRRVDLTAKEFAAKIGLTPVRLSQLENLKDGVHKRADLLVRLSIAALIATRDSKPFPNDLGHLVDQLERALDTGAHRLRHTDSPFREWVEAA